jgi:hypothetical protein
MRFLRTDRLYCFSPPVMIATFLLEIGFALYLIFRYKMTPVLRLAVALLVGLAVFQFAEYNICEGAWGFDGLTWSRIGHVIITLLPPLGMHMAVRMAGQKHSWLIAAGYAGAAAFSYIFMFVGEGLTGQACTGNYVIFNMAEWAVWPYTIYYYGWLIVGSLYAIYYGSKLKGGTRTALYLLAAGYASLLVPTTTANLIDPSTLAGIPSIMCGFAIIMAVILTFGIVPNYYSAKKR